MDRLRGLGNSVVPGLVEVLARAILEIDGST
jgi:site-specific DNA-cytosine methylase